MVSLFTAGSGRIIHSLADKSIRADRRRNFFLITTIALASCLIMSLALYIFGGSYQTRQFYRGRLQAAVLFVEPEQFAALSEDSNIEMAGLSLAAPLKELRTGRDMPYLFVKSWLPKTKINRTGTRSADNSANHVFFISFHLVQFCTSEKVYKGIMG